MLIYNSRGQLLLGERYGMKGHWQFPQGGVEPGQSRRATVFRELREELGIQRKHLGAIAKLKATHSYLWKKIPGYARGKWVGQTQTFWLVEFIGRDRDIDLAASRPQEFQDWRWCGVSTVRKIAARKRIAGYGDALAEFLKLRRGQNSKERKKGLSRTDVEA